LGWSECQDDVHKIESQCMVVKMTVLSFCTEAECVFQSETSITSIVVGAIGTVAVIAAAAATGSIAVAVAGGTALLLSKALSRDETQTTEAKEVDEEAEFKRQFVAHVTKKEQLIIDSTSANCSKQVEQ